MATAGAGGDPSVVGDPVLIDPAEEAARMAAAAQSMGALFGLPLYSGTNAIGQPYSNQLKPGADFMAKRTGQAAYNEGITNAFAPKSYMPSWAVQQPAAQWTGARPSPASYFPGIPTVSGGTPGSGTNLGFGALFGSLAPSTQTPGQNTLPLPNYGDGDGPPWSPGQTPLRPPRTENNTGQRGGGTGYFSGRGGTGTGTGVTTALTEQQLQAYRDRARTTPEQMYPGLNGIPANTPLDWAGNADAYSMTRDLAPEFGPLPPDARNQNVTAKWATGIHTFDPQTFQMKLTPLPANLQGAYIPPQYFGKALPAGAFTSLWPTEDGLYWGKTKPEGWSPTWRPTA